MNNIFYIIPFTICCITLFFRKNKNKNKKKIEKIEDKDYDFI